MRKSRAVASCFFSILRTEEKKKEATILNIMQKRLCIRRQTVALPALPAAFDGVRLVQLSDLHHRVYPNGEQQLLQAVRCCEPDWIVITGDLVSRDMTDFTERQQLLTALRAIAPVYLCLGNHEWDFQPKPAAAYRQMIVEAGCQLLDNTTVCLQRGESVCYLAGASLRIDLYHDAHFRYRNLASYTEADLTADLGTRQGCTILLAHNPLPAETYFAWGADLTLSGHVHGGVVRLPFIGGILSPERKLFPKYSKGWYGKDGKWMYVNCGIGKFRLGNPPEVTQITLHCPAADTK
jgi:predicted MPP superfamily phosphohydrolase